MTASPLRNLSRSLSKLGRNGSTSRLITGDKLSLDDAMEVQSDEFTWLVVMKDETPGKKVERTLAVGPEGLRILIPGTSEELGNYPYSKMKEYTYNAGHKVFQFSWLPSKTVEETIYLTTPKSREIHETIGKFLTNLLRDKKGIKDAEKIINECTYQRPPEVDKIKRGGTQRSYSTPSSGGVKKIRKVKKEGEEGDNGVTPERTSPAKTSDMGDSAKNTRTPKAATDSPKITPKSKNRGSESDEESQDNQESPMKNKLNPKSAPNTGGKIKVTTRKQLESDDDSDEKPVAQTPPYKTPTKKFAEAHGTNLSQSAPLNQAQGSPATKRKHAKIKEIV